MQDDLARVVATPAALALIDTLRAEHGAIMFHQSGGCCDGSSPMCYPASEFLVGDHDVKLGEIGGTPFYISRPSSNTGSTRNSCRRRERPRRHVLARKGRGLRFLMRSRLFTDAETACLAPVASGGLRTER